MGVDTQAPPMAVVLAVNITHDMKERGWTQEKLAVYSGVTRDTIGNIMAAREPGKAKGTTRGTIEAIATALDVPWTELVRVRDELAAEYAEAMRVYLDGIGSRPQTYVQPPLAAVG